MALAAPARGEDGPSAQPQPGLRPPTPPPLSPVRLPPAPRRKGGRVGCNNDFYFQIHFYGNSVNQLLKRTIHDGHPQTEAKLE